MLLCVGSDFMLLHSRIILSLFMALKHVCRRSSLRQKKNVDGQSLNLNLIYSHFSEKVWYIR